MIGEIEIEEVIEMKEQREGKMTAEEETEVGEDQLEGQTQDLFLRAVLRISEIIDEELQGQTREEEEQQVPAEVMTGGKGQLRMVLVEEMEAETRDEV